MAYGYNLHTVHNGMEKGAPVVLAAGTVHKYGQDDFDDLLAVDAVREPTDDEMKLYLLAHPDEADDDVVVASKPAKGKKGRPADPAPEPDAPEGGEGSGEALV